MPEEGGTPYKLFSLGGEEAEEQNNPDEDPVLALRELVIEARNIVNALRDLIRNHIVPQNDFLQRPERPAGSFERPVPAGDNFLAEGGQVHAMAPASIDVNRSRQSGLDEASNVYQECKSKNTEMDETTSGASSAALCPFRPSAAETASCPYQQGVTGAEAVRTPAVGAEANRPAVMGAESGRQASGVSEDCEILLPIKYARVSEIEAESFEQCEEISEAILVSSDSSLSNEDQ